MDAAQDQLFGVAEARVETQFEVLTMHFHDAVGGDEGGFAGAGAGWLRRPHGVVEVPEGGPVAVAAAQRRPNHLSTSRELVRLQYVVGSTFMRITRRGLQLSMGGLWLLDAALQFQPYMFSRAFAHEVILPTAGGQPAVVAAPIHLAGHVIAAHPIATNTAFALIQLALAAGLFLRRTSRVTLIASVGWSVAVWWLGEGLGGLISGHAMLLTGAPGAVLLYGLVAIAALPSSGQDGRGQPPSVAAVAAWVGTWAVGGIVQALPGQNSPGDIAAALRDSAAAGPRWLAQPTQTLAATVDHHGVFVIALVLLPLLIAAAAVTSGPARTASTVAGALLAAGFWAFGQGFGLIFSGQSTDPNSGPLLLLLAAAALAARRAVPAAALRAYPVDTRPVIARNQATAAA